MWKIYAIQHNKTKRIYVGSTHNIEHRYKAHLRALKGKRHTSQRMQDDFDEYGSDFTVTKLDEVADDVLIYIGKRFYKAYHFYEVKWMNKLNTIEDGYNYQDQTARQMIASKKELFESEVKPCQEFT